MIRFRQERFLRSKLESSRKSASSLVRDIISALEEIDANSDKQEDAINIAIRLIKRVPYLHRKDREDGTDRAFDTCNDSMDALFKAGIRGDVLRLIDDLVEVVQS